MFLKEKTILDPKAYTPTQQLFDAFIEYCRLKEISKLPYKRFGHFLWKLNPQLYLTREKVNGKYCRCWLGIKLKT